MKKKRWIIKKGSKDGEKEEKKIIKMPGNRKLSLIN